MHLLSLSQSRSHFIFQTASRSQQAEEVTVGKFVDLESKKSIVSVSIQRQRVSTTVAISDSGIAALGGSSGVIDLYYPIVDADASEEQLASTLIYRISDSKSYMIRSFKWHLSPVRALTFSLDGNYLLSGGNEKVLLFWQLDTSNVQFLPRLPGPITDIVIDKNSTTYAVSLGENYDDIVVFAATDLDARLHISGAKPAFPTLPPFLTSAYDTGSMLSSSSLRLIHLSKSTELAKAAVNAIAKVGAYAIPNYSLFPSALHSLSPSSYPYWYLSTGQNAQVQIYDATNGEQVGTHVIARTLQTGKVLFEDAITDPVISQLAISCNSEWMATVDETYTQPIDGLLSRSDVGVTLKFWAAGSESEKETVSWNMATRVRSPMGVNVPAAALVAAPPSFHGGQAFVTACHGGGVRLWRPRYPKINKARQVEWSARHIIEPSYAASIARSSLLYNAKDEIEERDDVVLSWAADGSLLIMGIGSLVHVISVPLSSSASASFDIVRTLAGIVEGPVRGLGVLDSSIVALSQSRVTVFDILQDKISWSAEIGYTPKSSKSLIAFGSSTFAVAVNHIVTHHRVRSIASNLYVFSPTSNLPVHVLVHPRPIAAVHAVSGGVRQRYTFIDTDKLVYTLSAPDSKTGKRRSSAITASVAPATVVETEDEEPIGVTAIMHPKSGKFTISESKRADSDDRVIESARENVVLAPSIVDQVFTRPEYATGDFDRVFDKLLDVIGQREA